MKKIVVVGAGFAGLNAILELEKRFRKDPEVSLTLVDREDYHLFTPNLYEVATAEEEFTSVAQVKSSVVLPLSQIIGNKAIVFIKGELTELDAQARKLKVGIRTLEYDYLILALGDRPDFSRVEGAHEHALALGSLPGALRIRNALEFAVQSASHEVQRDVLRVVVVGGGYVAVKFAGELKSFLDILSWKYGYPRERLEIMIVESSDKLVAGLGKDFGRQVFDRLTALGVRIEFHHHAIKFDHHFVEFLNGERMGYEVLVWSLGTIASSLPGPASLPKTLAGRLEVDEYLKVKQTANIFAAGNLAQVLDKHGQPAPRSAAVAAEQGRYVAQALACLMQNQKPRAYSLGFYAVTLRVGGKWGLLKTRRWQLAGYFAFWADLYFHFRHYWRLLGFWPAAQYVFREKEIFSRND